MNARRVGFAETRFGNVRYWTVGEGPRLLLIHQSAQASEEYDEASRYLARDFAVVSVDLPGHGASGDPDHELTVEEYTDAIVDVLDVLQVQSAHVAGHHGGAYLALSLAVSYPDRVGSVTMSGAGILPKEITDKLLNTPMSRDLPLDEQGEFLRKTWDVYRKMTAPGMSAAVTMKPFLVGLDARTRPYDMHYAVLRWDRDAALASYSKPTLLIRALDDMYGGDIDALRDRIPGSEIVDVAGGGSWLFYEQPKVCASAIARFLQTT